MKKCLAYILIFIFLCSTSNYSIDYVLGKQIEKQSPYYLSFASIGAIYLESRLDCWAKIRTSSSQEELEKYLGQILQNLDLVLQPQHVKVNSTELATILNYKLEEQNRTILMTIKSDNRLNESYFLLSIISRDKKINLHDYEDRLNRSIGINWQYYYLYQGEIPHLIGPEAGKELTAAMLDNLQAKKIETYEYGGMVSTTAFSNLLKQEITPLSLKGMQYNVQIAVRNNKDKKKTEIYIGSPLILGEI